MAKKNKVPLKFFDAQKNQTYTLDSTEEWQFFNWVIEARNLGIILDYEYQPASFELTPKYSYIPLFGNPKNAEKFLFREHVYTADFRLIVNKYFAEKLSKTFKFYKENMLSDGNFEIYVDTKGEFNRNSRSFSINQKFVWLVHGKYIQKIVPKIFFKDFGCPEACHFTPRKKQRTHHFEGFPTLKNVFLT